MLRPFTTLFLVLLTTALRAQPSTVPLPLSFSLVGGTSPAQTAVALSRQLLGRPYVAHTLDGYPTEQLVVNLLSFDCTTYLESVLALSLACTDQDFREKASPHRTVLIQAGGNESQTPLDKAFRQYLTQLRYRNGRIDGYASRLHYFSDWLHDNERKGLLTDVTGELPGVIQVAKPVTYMTGATYRYPALSDPAVFRQVALTEAALSQQPFPFIPRKNVRQAEARLQEGDIVMLTAARPGLDMRHVGLAVRQPNGRMHLLHASSDRGAVVITSCPITDYVLWHKHLSGIRVARLRGSSFPAVATNHD